MEPVIDIALAVCAITLVFLAGRLGKQQRNESSARLYRIAISLVAVALLALLAVGRWLH